MTRKLVAYVHMYLIKIMSIQLTIGVIFRSPQIKSNIEHIPIHLYIFVEKKLSTVMQVLSQGGNTFLFWTNQQAIAFFHIISLAHHHMHLL